MKDFYPYDIDISTIPVSKSVTDPSVILKLKLSAEIIMIVRKMDIDEALAKTGLNRADFSRITRQHIQRFSTDRLLKVLFRLGQTVSVTVKPKKVA
jgi:predicted XRE-type DNA-binding protein